MLIHLQDALDSGSTTCLVRTVDTDVVVIIIGKFHALLANHPAADIWIAFGTGKNFMYIHINAICSSLRRNKSMALPIFHCFTGCDTTSSFFGKGKKTAWETWKSYPEVTEAFLYMAGHPHIPITVEAQNFQLLERFSVILYDKTSSLESVNEARRELFCQKNKPMETWKLFHQLRMLCYSTVNVLPTKLGSGQPVNWHNSGHLLLKDVVGH